MVKEIKILGSSCSSCINLEKNVKLALEKSEIKANVVKETDFAKIIEYGVMSVPALVFDEEVVSYNRVLPVNEIIEMLEEK